MEGKNWVKPLLCFVPYRLRLLIDNYPGVAPSLPNKLRKSSSFLEGSLESNLAFEGAMFVSDIKP